MSGPSRAPAASVLGRALVAELTRLLTIRSTWWSVLAGAGLMLFIGGVAGSQAPDSGEAAPIWFAAEFAILPGHFAFLLVVLMAVTGEYATGAIRSTLQWVPRRGLLLTARILVPVAFATGCAVVVAGATDLVAWALLGEKAEVVVGDIVRSLGMIALVVAVGGLLAVGLGLILRSTAGTLISLVLLIFALPVMLGSSGAALLTTVSEHLPGSVMISLLAAADEPRDAATVATVLVAWPATVLFLGGWALIHRDAS